MIDEIEYVVDDPVATITLRRPETLNAAVQHAALDRADAKEGAAALMEKRSPTFPRLGVDAGDRS